MARTAVQVEFPGDVMPPRILAGLGNQIDSDLKGFEYAPQERQMRGMLNPVAKADGSNREAGPEMREAIMNDFGFASLPDCPRSQSSRRRR